jgi:hypothetical protein
MFGARKRWTGWLALAFASMLMAVVAIVTNPAPAKANDVWPVKGKLLGELKEAKYEKSTDVSGIACATATGFPRTCLLADDETQGVQIVIVKDEVVVAGDFIRLIYDAHDGKLLELDAEGVAYADGYFYVIGSHGRPRHEENETDEDKKKNDAKAKASRHLFRLRFDSDAVDRDGRLKGAVEIKPSTELSGFIRAEPALGPSFNGTLKDEGLTLEGVAVKAERLYVGMRGPVLGDGKAAVLSVPLRALFGGGGGTGQLHSVDLGKRRGVRDLVAFDNGFLVLAGPVNDPPKGKVSHGDYSVFWWNGNNQHKLLGDLDSYGKKVKPEALLPLDRRGAKLRILLFFDGPDEGAPRAVEVDHP